MKGVIYMQPIDSIKGKLPLTSAINSDVTFPTRMQGCLNKGIYNQLGVTYNTIKPIGSRNFELHPIGEDEIAARTRFAAVSALVKARRADGTKRPIDQANFKAQTAYKTMTAYLWHICGVQYDEELANAGE